MTIADKQVADDTVASAAVAANLTMKDAAAALRDGSLTSVALTEAVVDKATRLNGVLGAYVEIMRDAALEQAAAADAAFAAGEDKGPLQGLPLAIKDIIALQGVPNTGNSETRPADAIEEADAPVVARLREAGAVFVGKSTTSEFAIGLPDDEKRFPIPRNPWDIARTPAGSSSGTGVAVAAGLALGGLGTDTGGSVRGPACVNGHTGLKVTFGRVPKSGVLPLGYSLDSVGPMARSAYDCAMLLEVMAGYDATDPYCATAPVESYTAALDGNVEGLRIGLPTEYFFDHEQLDDEVRKAVLAGVQKLTDLGATATEFVLPNAELGAIANQVILFSEAFAYHRNTLVERWSDYGRFTRHQLARGAVYHGGDLAQANRFRQQFAQDVAAAFADYDVLITPSAPVPAQLTEGMHPSQRLTQPSYTGHWNLTGLPAIAVPAGFTESGLPLSLQVVGKPFAEAQVLKVADALQRVTDHHLAAPPVDALA